MDTIKRTITCLWLLLAAATAKNIGLYPAKLPDISSPSLPVQQWNEQDEIGQASFGYSYSGQAASNVLDADGNMAGSWAYVDAEGKVVNVSYVADKRGFRISSNVLPVAPVVGSVEVPLDSVKTAEIPAPNNNFNDSNCTRNMSNRSKRQSELTGEMNFGVSVLTDTYGRESTVGMKETGVLQYPFMVALLTFDKTLKRYTLACGGSLISADKILTAAHCVDDPNLSLNDYIVKVGVHRLEDNNVDDAIYTKRLNWIRMHEDYERSSRYNDIAILTIESPVKFDAITSTICLPKQCHEGAHAGYAKFLGWGNTKLGGKNSDFLLETTGEMMDNKECVKHYTGEKEIADHMICAFGLKDFCENFDGGPLFLERPSEDCPWVQMGIISFGRGCLEESKPAVYTRLTSFWPWIENHFDTAI